MDKKKQKKVKKEQVLPGQISYPLLYLQALLTIAMIILGILSLINSKIYFDWFELILGITLFDIGFNNAKIFKRNGGTILYIGVGAVLFFLALLSLLRV